MRAILRELILGGGGESSCKRRSEKFISRLSDIFCFSQQQNISLEVDNIFVRRFCIRIYLCLYPVVPEKQETFSKWRTFKTETLQNKKLSFQLKRQLSYLQETCFR